VGTALLRTVINYNKSLKRLYRNIKLVVSIVRRLKVVYSGTWYVHLTKAFLFSKCCTISRYIHNVIAFMLMMKCVFFLYGHSQNSKRLNRIRCTSLIAGCIQILQ